MDFMAAFPDADFDLMTRYFSMEPAAGEDNVLTMAAGGEEVNVHESLFCSFLPAEMMNYSTTTTTTTTTTNSSSGNNSPLFDPAAQEISYYDDHHHYHFAPPSTNFFNVEEETAAHYSISNGGFPFEAPAIVPSVEWQQLKRKLQSHVPVSPSDKKRPRRNQKSCNHRQEEEATSNDVTNNGQSSSSCNSEEEIVNGSSSLLHEGEAQKSRTSRGSATDPQSIYARKRRERINERLRILQTLVPNGTKVDISTMLEEAVHYVKFLQLQIKLLSSDNLWMYAPIAYNGVDVGLNQKLSTLL